MQMSNERDHKRALYCLVKISKFSRRRYNIIILYIILCFMRDYLILLISGLSIGQFRPSEIMIVSHRITHRYSYQYFNLKKKRKYWHKQKLVYRYYTRVNLYLYDVPYGLCKAASLKADKYKTVIIL